MRSCTTITLDAEWFLEDDGIDVLMRGPGQLELLLKHFAPTHLEHTEGLPQGDSRETLRQIAWYCPLDPDGPPDAWSLEFIITWDARPPTPDADGILLEHERLYRLHVGPQITWRLSPEAGERLQAWFASQEEHA